MFHMHTVHMVSQQETITQHARSSSRRCCWGQAGGEEEEDKEESSGEKGTKESEKYSKFWNAFGKSLKLGVIEDTTNRQRLAKLLRFYSSKSPDKLTSLDDYISRMKDGQKQIYYLAGMVSPVASFSPSMTMLLMGNRGK